MKRHTLVPRIGLVVGIVILSTSPVTGQIEQSETPEALLGRALHLEEVAGDLSGALRLYERIVEDHPEARAISSRALLQMGRCYERMGDLKARAAYERVLRDYPDQDDSAAVARTRLAELQAREAVATAAGARSSGPVDRELPEITGTGFVGPIEMSPDDRRALFYGITFGVAGGQNIGIHDYGSRKTTWLTNHRWDTPEVPLGISATWAADGTRVAYSTIRRSDGPESEVSEIWIAEPGRAARVVYRAEQTMAYVSDWLGDRNAVVAVLQRPDRSAAIGVITLDDGKFRQLKTLAWAREIFPASSPDGRFIVFEDGTRDARDLFIGATDGSFIRPLDEHPALDAEPLWSPDGGHIAFRSNRQGIEGIWAVPVDDGRPAGQPFLVTDRAEGVSLQSWTRGGILYRKSGGVSDIYTVDLDPETGSVISVPRMLPYPDTGANMQPLWSPDGRHLAFLTGEASGRSARRSLVVMSLDDGRTMQADPPEEAFYTVGNIRWRPDSREISLNSRDRQNRPILLRLSLPDAQWTVEPLPEDLRYLSFDWDPNWDRFFYYRSHELAAPGLYEVDRATGERRFLWEPPMHPIRDIVTSPDGRYIAFATLARLCIFDRETGTGRQIPDIKAIPGFAWSPDGRSLLYVGHDAPGTGTAEAISGDLGLRVFDVDTGLSRDLNVPEIPSNRARAANFARAANLDTRLMTPAWAPDGGPIGFVHRVTSMEFRVLEDPLAGKADAGSGLGARR